MMPLARVQGAELEVEDDGDATTLDRARAYA